MVSFSGVEPLRQHLVSAKHKKKILGIDIKLPTLPPKDYSFEKSRNGISSLQKNSAQSFQDAFDKGYIIGDLGSITSPFQCKVCNVTLSGLAPLKDHVASAKHIKKTNVYSGGTNGLNFADYSCEKSRNGISSLQNNSAQSVSYNNSQIQDDFDKGYIIGDLGSSTSPFQCNVCNVTLSGLAPLKDHVASSKHIKKTNVYSGGTNSLNFAASRSSMGCEADTLNESFDLGHVRCASDSSVSAYFCEICQTSLSGEVPLRQHIHSENHAKKLRIKGGAFDMSGLKNSLSKIGTAEVSSIVMKAIEDGHVCKEEISLAGTYFCKVCNVPLTAIVKWVYPKGCGTQDLRWMNTYNLL